MKIFFLMTVFNESFTLTDMMAPAGEDMVVALPALVGGQLKIKKEEQNRKLPVDMRYPRTLNWQITFTVPAGYVAKGIENMNTDIYNECGRFSSNAKMENNILTITVKKIYNGKHFENAQWPQLVQILNAAYNFSQSKIILKKV